MFDILFFCNVFLRWVDIYFIIIIIVIIIIISSVLIFIEIYKIFFILWELFGVLVVELEGIMVDVFILVFGIKIDKYFYWMKEEVIGF